MLKPFFITCVCVRLFAKHLKSITACIVIILYTPVSAQNYDIPEAPEVNIEEELITKKKTVYTLLELKKQPEYSDGGIKGFYKYISSNFNVPKITESIVAKVCVSFIIEKDGSMSNLKILRDPGYGLGDETLRVLKEIDTKWIPGEKDGKVVRVSYNLPLTVEFR